MEPSPGIPAANLVTHLRAAGCVYAEEEAEILLEAAGTAGQLEDMVRRRVEGFPLEHIVGWAAFHGQRITVAPGVFVPRLRTEYLVQQAAMLLHGQPDDADSAARPGNTLRQGNMGGGNGGGTNAVVLDLCCGSGAIGAALAAELPGLEVHAADIDPVAVKCAAVNLASCHGTAYCGDLFAPLPAELRGRISLITANAPYVPTQDIAFMPQEARIFEPDRALNGGTDGLDIQRRIAAAAPRWLCPGGYLVVETSPAQAAESVRILQRNGLTATTVHSEDLDGTAVMGLFNPGEGR